MTTLLERVREAGRQAMRRQIEQRKAAGQPLFTETQIAVLHQQLRDRRSQAVTAT